MLWYMEVVFFCCCCVGFVILVVFDELFMFFGFLRVWGFEKVVIIDVLMLFIEEYFDVSYF